MTQERLERIQEWLQSNAFENESPMAEAKGIIRELTEYIGNLRNYARFCEVCANSGEKVDETFDEFVAHMDSIRPRS